MFSLPILRESLSFLSISTYHKDSVRVFFFAIMDGSNDINQQMAGLGIDEEENESFVLDDDIEEDVNRYELCLVGKLLTEKLLMLEP